MTEVYRRKPVPPDWPRPTSIVTREIDISSGLLATQYCPRNLVTTEFYISGTEPTRDCDKHGPYANPGGAFPVDTFSTIPLTNQPTGGGQPINVTPPALQPGYEPVPSRGQQQPQQRIADDSRFEIIAAPLFRRTGIMDVAEDTDGAALRHSRNMQNPSCPPKIFSTRVSALDFFMARADGLD